jgi:hypothetical protein
MRSGMVVLLLPLSAMASALATLPLLPLMVQTRKQGAKL